MTIKDPYANYPVKTYRKLTTRPYQQQCIDKAIEHCKESSDPVIMDISVGGGKSLIVAAIADHVAKKGGNVLVVSRQSIIIDQNSKEAFLMGVYNSIYSAGLNKKSTTYPVVMASEGTLANALKKDIAYDNGEVPEPSEFHNKVFHLVLIDEAHHLDILDEEGQSQYHQILKELYRRNPKLRVIGLTGSPFRGVVNIIGQDLFWKKKIAEVSQDYMIDMGYLVPLQFGAPDCEKYDLSEFDVLGQDGTQEYTAEQMRQMEKKLTSDKTMTQKVVADALEKTKDRNCVIFTVAGKKHAKEVAACLPEGSYAIITDEMPDRARDKALTAAYNGDIKYLIQLHTLVTGYNNPRADAIVILRRISSLTLLVQLIGRVLRLLKPEMIEAGVVKENGLILDYTDTMDKFRELYDSRELDEYDLQKSKQEEKTLTCPKCGEENGFHAVRCRGVSATGERCDFFWRSKVCQTSYRAGVLYKQGCGAENSPSARTCRVCENILNDWDEKLKHKHYTENDFIPVVNFDIKPTQNGGVAVEYHLDNGVVAREFFPNCWDKSNPKNAVIKRIVNNNLINKLFSKADQPKAYRARNAGELCSLKPLIKVQAVTHRKSGSKDIIAKTILLN